VAAVQKLLGQIGLEEERVRMFNVSSAMGPQFAQYAAEMTEQIQQVGPSPLSKKTVVVKA
jgi:coenzyme F420-reducing hydrogenase delta subunit